MVQEEGIFRPIRGMNAMAAGAGPAHAMYFTALEEIKLKLVNSNIPEHVGSGKNEKSRVFRVKRPRFGFFQNYLN